MIRAPKGLERRWGGERARSWRAQTPMSRPSVSGRRIVARIRGRIQARALFALVLGAVFSGSLWAAAQPSSDSWQVREVAQHRPLRVRLTGSWFILGSDETELARASALCTAAGLSDCAKAQFAAETPARRVYVRRFEIDRLEVSNADYQRCVNLGRCLPARPSASATRPQAPVVQLTWREARDYCHFMGGDLPTEAQWEYAAHGDSRRAFPWGAEFQPELASFAGRDARLHDVTAYPLGKSFFGLLNQAGNVWELVLDRYVAPYSTHAASVDPVQLGARGPRVLRGGSFRSPPHMLRTRYRAAIGEDEPRSDVGFRCAYTAPKQ